MSSFKTAKGTELPIMDIKGKPYLQVAHRLVWFREERPAWTIETDYLSVSESSVFAKAVIRDEAGRILSTAHKFEDKQGFPDFREKAESGAIGRALAMIGYGTQFCADDLDEGSRLADSPVAPQGSGARPVPRPNVAAQIQQANTGLSPECCGSRMMVSRYNPNEFFCQKCKAKAPRSAA
jgi:hypothetical protein